MDKDKVKRTPRTYESIEKGALALGLQERVTLSKALNASIAKEVSDLKVQAENAAKIANGQS